MDGDGAGVSGLRSGLGRTIQTAPDVSAGSLGEGTVGWYTGCLRAEAQETQCWWGEADSAAKVQPSGQGWGLSSLSALDR